MATKKAIYVTTMYRWGKTDTHSYVQYAGNKKAAAIKAGVEEEEWRGMKYSFEVVEFVKNKDKEVIVARVDEPLIK